jgi:hypothetical protein
MGVRNIVQAIPLTSVLSSAINASTYTAITAAGGLPAACFLLRINSTSTTDVTISYDGVNDHEFLLHGTSMQIESQANNRPQNSVALFPAGMVVYAKGTAGTGSIYLSGYYQPSGV